MLLKFIRIKDTNEKKDSRKGGRETEGERRCEGKGKEKKIQWPPTFFTAVNYTVTFYFDIINNY